MIGLHRIRFLGKVRLCINDADHPGDPRSGPQDCANYPLRPSSGQGIDHTNVFLGPICSGRCRHKNFQLITAVVLSPDLTASLQAPGRRARMASVPIPSAFNVRGPLVHAVARGWQPIALVLKDAQGKTASRIAITPGGSCTTLSQ